MSELSGYTRLPTCEELPEESALVDTGDGPALPRQERGYYRTRNLNSELLHAVYRSDHDAVLRLLEKGASPQTTCRENGMSPLHAAAFLGNVETVEVLLKKGSRAAQKDKKGRTAAHLAAWSGKQEILQLLLDRSNLVLMSQPVSGSQDDIYCDLNSTDTISHNHSDLTFLVPEEISHKSTPLHIACKRTHWKCVEFLLSLGVDVSPRDQDYLTPLDVVGLCMEDRDSSSDFSTRRQPNIVKALLNRGAKFPKEKGLTTILHSAVRALDIPLVRFLLEVGFEVSARDCKGQTAVHLAVTKLNLECLKTILSCVPDAVNVRDGTLKTPLHMAVLQDWRSGISFLLENGADVTACTYDRNTVIHIAAERGNYIILEELLCLPEAKRIVDEKDTDNRSALFRAVAKDHVDCVKLLRQYGADMDLTLPSGLTLLHSAAECNSPGVIKYLLTDPTVPNRLRNVLYKFGNKRKSALHLAARNGNLESVVCILQHDKEALRVCDENGWYPLHDAALNGHKDCTRYMIKAGADLSSRVRIESGGHLKWVSALDLIMSYISQPVDFLEDIFDTYIKASSPSQEDPNTEIEVKCNVLVPDCEADQMKVLNAIVANGNEELDRLILHPVSETFLYLKWQTLKIFFYITLILYFLLTLCATALALLFHVFGKPLTAIVSHQMDSILTSTLLIVLTIVLGVSLFLIIVIELITIPAGKPLKDYETWCKLGALVCIVATSVDHQTLWARDTAAVGVLLLWTEMLFLVARLPDLGSHVLMFTRVAEKVIKVFATFTFITLGFTFAMMIHFKTAQPFHNVWAALVKVLIMTTEIDYGNQGVEKFDDLGGISLYGFVGRSLYLAYDFLVVTVLMNLVVGLAVSDVSNLQKHGRAQRLSKQVMAINQLEMWVYSSLGGCLPQAIRAPLQRRRKVRSWIISGRNAVPSSVFPKLPQVVRNSILKKVLDHQAKDRQQEGVIRRPFVEPTTSFDGTASLY